MEELKNMVGVGEIFSLTLYDAEQMFSIAESVGRGEEFSQWFWSQIHNNSSNMDGFRSILEDLEDYKRNLGRRYDRHIRRGQSDCAEFIKEQYNKTEDNIVFITSLYNLQRKSKNYKL